MVSKKDVEVDFSGAVETINTSKNPVNKTKAAEMSKRLLGYIADAENAMLNACVAAYEFDSSLAWEALGYSSRQAYAEAYGISAAGLSTMIDVAKSLLVKHHYALADLKGIPLRKLRVIARKSDTLKKNGRIDEIIAEARHSSYVEFEEAIATATRPQIAPSSGDAETEKSKVTPERAGRQATGNVFDQSSAEEATSGPASKEHLKDPREGNDSGEFLSDDSGRVFMPAGIYVIARIPDDEALDVDEEISQGAMVSLSGRVRLYQKDKKNVYVRVT